MKSPRAKVLHLLNGRPLLAHVLATVAPLHPERVLVVVGFQADEVRAACPDDRIRWVLQTEQLGTGHAVMQTAQALADFSGDVLIVCGDMPLLKSASLESLVSEHRRHAATGTLLILKTPEFKDFGRIVRDAEGRISRIVEVKDASAQEKTIDEYNSGAYCFEKVMLFKALAEIDNKNAQQEYYLTDTIKYLVEHRQTLHAVVTQDVAELSGINTEADLQQAEALIKIRTPSAL
jgi:UDP-N-acetylglucosamine diphosphorylase/glucosamine-1-phosphate N-acetyltransferase